GRPDLARPEARLAEFVQRAGEELEIHSRQTRTMRLGKFLATAGVASRRSSEVLIRAGRVRVNGRVVIDPARDVTALDAVSVDGEAVRQPRERVVYAVNKPVGVVSTVRDPQRRDTVVALVPDTVRLYPVGRLDADSSGLILLTNDGELAHRLTHPRFEVAKTYVPR
ncbi:MAG TPA: pseudouridine synthase, partial [Thermoleophilia bacterium]|nr:pseudouridine synthase [Thermoleophilia bacterium]